jgi:hypothetical protein
MLVQLTASSHLTQLPGSSPLLYEFPFFIEELVGPEGRRADDFQPAHTSYRTASNLLYLLL